MAKSQAEATFFVYPYITLGVMTQQKVCTTYPEISQNPSMGGEGDSNHLVSGGDLEGDSDFIQPSITSLNIVIQTSITTHTS